MNSFNSYISSKLVISFSSIYISFLEHYLDFEVKTPPLIHEPVIVDYGDLDETGFVNGRVGDEEYKVRKK